MQSKPTQAHGPYIVTTWPECPGCVDPSSAPHLAKPPLSRRAVATLEEASTVAQEACGTDLMARLQASLVSESGGTVTLPDGTVIQVEPGPAQQKMRSDLRRWGSDLDTLRWSDEGIVVAWARAHNEQASRV